MKEAKKQLSVEQEDWSPHVPHPKQQKFLEFNGLEGMYGGAAGGGKSDALLMAALEYVHVPGYSALLLRKTYADLALNNALMDRMHQWMAGKPVKWHPDTKTFVFPSGAKVAFGYLDSKKDHYRYQSAEYQFIAFDELTQFEEFQYTYMFSRMRKNAGVNIPIRMRSATNPGGQGHEWVKKRFKITGENQHTGYILENLAFVPATLKDNELYVDASYAQSLEQLDDVTKAQLSEGDWEVSDDGLVPISLMETVETQPCLWEDGVQSRNRPELYMGVDVGRSSDRFVIWTWEKIADVLWTREIAVFQGEKFRTLKREVTERLDSGNYERCHIDKGGIGMQLAEELEDEYRNTVFGVALGQRVMGRLGAQLKTAMLERSIRIPYDPELRRDFRNIKRIHDKAGVPVLVTEKNETGHGDRFWAAALGRDAAGNLDRQPTIATPPRGYRVKSI